MNQLEFLKKVVNSIKCNDVIFYDALVNGDFEQEDVIYYIEFLTEYGHYVQNQFETCFDNSMTISKELELCLDTLNKISKFYDLDNWENIINYIIEPFAQDVWQRQEKVEWKTALLDKKTAKVLKDYLNAYWG